jgi:NADPH-dependent 2,4-dienoyl-CoA reductase/sulfur reductase-like enzyme/nitrite reductase/ring-hydroxylating ferredoxin subunit
MAHAAELSGPDLANGVAISGLTENAPFLGHAHGEAIVLVRSGRDIHAVGATCSHYSGPLAEGLVVGDTLRCPWHHACFDLRTGDALGAPALNAIACYETQRRGDRVIVGAKKARTAPTAPPKSPANVVIVGAGAAGAAAAERLRHLGYRGPITLIGNEVPGPVDRPNLSKDFLAGAAPMEWIPLRTDEFYGELDIHLLKNETVVELDTAKKTATLGSGGVLSYDALLLATGAEPVRLAIPGATLPHVRTLRTLADAQAIIDVAAKARRAVIIGSSFIGLEAAASLRARNLEVHVVGRDEVPLERVLGAQLGKYIQELHEEHGVVFHLEASPRAIRETAVELANGKVLDADLVVLGVGVRPRIALAEKAGLEISDGVLVDSMLRTSAPYVWAAGDITRYPQPHLTDPIRVEHWVVAERQGQAVARDMLGLGTPFADVPFFWSQHYDVTLAYVGHADGKASVSIMGSLRKRDATVIYRSGGRVAAVVTVGRDRQSLAIEAALQRNDVAAIEGLLSPGHP